MFADGGCDCGAVRYRLQRPPLILHACSACGTTVFSDYRRAPGSHWWVRVGTLDDPSLCAPDLHIFTRSKHPAVALPEGARAFEAYYERDKVWPAESLARMEANIQSPSG